MTKRIRRHEFIFLLIWPAFASILSLVLDAQIYTSMFLFFGVPAVYLSWKHPNLIKKSLVFSLIFSVPATFFIDYVMQLTNGWMIERIELPHIQILEHVSLLQIIWLILFTYFIVIYYEVFFDRSISKVIYPRTKWLLLAALGVIGFVVSNHFFNPEALYINYFYLKIGVISVLMPLLVFTIGKSSLYSKFLKVGGYFFFVTLIYEITALRLEQWSFPAKEQFIGHVSLFKHSFPVEELIFWIILS